MASRTPSLPTQHWKQKVKARSHSALQERRYAPLTAQLAALARLNARRRKEPLSTAPKVEPVSTLGAVESVSVRHRALCEPTYKSMFA